MAETQQTARDRRLADYETIARAHSGLIARMAAAYEADATARQDLEQDIHAHLWKSLELFAGQASLSTWTWRVAHNVCARHVERAVRARRVAGLADIAELDPADTRPDPEQQADAALALERLYSLIRRLRPTDRQVVLAYLEGVDAAGIAEITGLTPGAVATRIHRIKALLAEGFAKEGAA